MRWIQASLTLVVLLIGLALGKAGAAEDRPGHIDSAPADVVRGVVHDGVLGADSHQGPIPSFNLADPLESLILSHPFLAAPPNVGLWPHLDSLIPALPFLVETPPVAVIGQHRRPAGWPVTTVRRLTWLQRFLF
jgi:hypothetical protein